MQEIKTKLATSLKKYCDDNGFNEVILGLSGGIDSAVVMAIAIEALGAQNVNTIMMKTKYTSDLSINLAAKIAKDNGVKHSVLNIQPMLDATLATMEFVPKVATVEQNIQARIRGLLLMGYSNEYNFLNLACGNKSEAAMGYCTLYGDTCGGIAPIADLYKTQVYELARFFNQEGKISIPEEIINRAPTAELATGQKDTDNLLPYAELDEILENYVFGNMEPNEADKDKVNAVRTLYKKMAFKRAQMPQAIKIG